MDELSDIEMTEADFKEAASGIKDSDDGPQGYEEGEPDEETAGAEGEVERSETRSTGVVEASRGGFPTTDVAARDVLLRHAGERWKCVQGETLWVYEDGVWVEGESAFMTPSAACVHIVGHRQSSLPRLFRPLLRHPPCLL